MIGTELAQTGTRSYLPIEPLVCSGTSFEPAPCLSLLPTMSSPTHHVSKKEVEASYRPKSHVGLLLDPVPDVQSQHFVPLFLCATSFDC